MSKCKAAGLSSPELSQQMFVSCLLWRRHITVHLYSNVYGYLNFLRFSQSVRRQTRQLLLPWWCHTIKGPFKNHCCCFWQLSHVIRNTCSLMNRLVIRLQIHFSRRFTIKQTLHDGTFFNLLFLQKKTESLLFFNSTSYQWSEKSLNLVTPHRKLNNFPWGKSLIYGECPTTQIQRGSLSSPSCLLDCDVVTEE